MISYPYCILCPKIPKITTSHFLFIIKLFIQEHAPEPQVLNAIFDIGNHPFLLVPCHSKRLKQKHLDDSNEKTLKVPRSARAEEVLPISEGHAWKDKGWHFDLCFFFTINLSNPVTMAKPLEAPDSLLTKHKGFKLYQTFLCVPCNVGCLLLSLALQRKRWGYYGKMLEMIEYDNLNVAWSYFILTKTQAYYWWPWSMAGLSWELKVISQRWGMIGLRFVVSTQVTYPP